MSQHCPQGGNCLPTHSLTGGSHSTSRVHCRTHETASVLSLPALPCAAGLIVTQLGDLTTSIEYNGESYLVPQVRQRAEFATACAGPALGRPLPHC